MDFDLLITGGEVFDGSGRPGERRDIGIRGDRIAEIGGLKGATARQVLSAEGRWVIPGLIDSHSHSDSYLLIEPAARSKLYQGVTTEVVGQCGTSAAPLLGKARLPSDWENKPYPGRWRTTAEYRALLEQVRPAVNVVLLTGHGKLRAAVMGYEGRPASAGEVAQMAALLEAAMEEGSRGLSSGLIYAPGLFAEASELEALAHVAARRGGVYATHMRSEGARLWEAIDETLTLTRHTGIRTILSHLKTSGRANWSKLDAALERIHRIRAEGFAVYADRYPYTASNTDLDVLLPAWAVEGGREAVLARLRDSEIRSRLIGEMMALRSAEEWETIMVAMTHHPETRPFSGLRLPEIARRIGLSPAEAALWLIERDALGTTAFFFGMSKDNMRRILAEPWVMIGSDASVRAPDGPLSADYPHPRAYGTFARFLRLSLEGKTVQPAEAIRKMTQLPATVFGLSDRGRIQQGAAADIVVLDPKTLRDRADYASPHRLAEGIEHVIVNGCLTLESGRLTGRRAGRVL